MTNPTLETIYRRRSVREFEPREIDTELIDTILEAGRWAPSGRNNQPWRFIVLKNRENIEKVAQCSKYSEFIRHAPIVIAIFLDTNVMYDRTKDVQSIGACIQNMLLAVHSLGLGAVWIGEILNKKDEVNKILKVPNNYELMAVIPIGYPTKRKRTSQRKALSEIAFKEYYGIGWEGK